MKLVIAASVVGSSVACPAVSRKLPPTDQYSHPICAAPEKSSWESWTSGRDEKVYYIKVIPLLSERNLSIAFRWKAKARYTE